MLEELVLSHVSSFLNSHDLWNTFLSAYRPYHSTETGLLIVANDVFASLIKGNISILALLDISSAFDTIDHSILVHRLHTDFGFTDIVLQWSSSYLMDHTHYVSLFNHCSVLNFVYSWFSSWPYTYSCILSLCQLLFIHTLSRTFHSLMTYDYRCLLILTRYLSYFTLCSHVEV